MGEERVWQSDPGKEDGLQLTVLRFERYRCPNCYDIDTRLTFYGESVDTSFVVRPAVVDGKRMVVMSAHVGEDIFELDCGPTKF